MFLVKILWVQIPSTLNRNIKDYKRTRHRKSGPWRVLWLQPLWVSAMPCCRTLNFYCKLWRFCSMNVACTITKLIEPGLKPLRPKTVCASYLATTPRKHCTSGQWFEWHAYLAPHSPHTPLEGSRSCMLDAVSFWFVLKCSQMFLMILHSISLHSFRF